MNTLQETDEITLGDPNLSDTILDSDNIYEDIVKVAQPAQEKKRITVSYNFCKGAFVEIESNQPGDFKVEFFNQDDLLYSTEIKDGCWAKCLLQYYIPYTVKVTDLADGEVIFNETLDLKDKRVVIEFGSKSLGDTLAWLPYADEFQRKHSCQLFVVTFQNHLFEGQYPNLSFSEPGTAFENINAWYQIGWFYDGDIIDRFKHPIEVKTQPMQKTASDILGLEYKEIRPRLTFKRSIWGKGWKKFVSIAPHSTAQAKYYNNPDGFQGIVNYLKEKDYDVVLLSKEQDGYMGNKNPEGVIYPPDYDINTIMDYLRHSEFFIGVGSGLSWLSWALNVPTVLISGFSEPYTEMQGAIRIDAPEGKCRGCFNRYKLNPSDWNWCADHKDTDRMFECTKSITPASVIEQIKTFNL